MLSAFSGTYIELIWSSSLQSRAHTSQWEWKDNPRGNVLHFLKTSFKIFYFYMYLVIFGLPVYGVTQRWTRLKWLSSSSSMLPCIIFTMAWWTKYYSSTCFTDEKIEAKSSSVTCREVGANPTSLAPQSVLLIGVIIPLQIRLSTKVTEILQLMQFQDKYTVGWNYQNNLLTLLNFRSKYITISLSILKL